MKKVEYGYEKVLEVQRRCGITFEEADKALKAEKGDVDKACVYAMRKKKTNEVIHKQVGSMMNFITYRVKISKNGESKFDMSLGVVLLISLFILILTAAFDGTSALGAIYIVIFVIVIFTGYSLEFIPGKKKEEPKIDKMAHKKKTEEEVYSQNTEQAVEPEDNGYNTIEIE